MRIARPLIATLASLAVAAGVAVAATPANAALSAAPGTAPEARPTFAGFAPDIRHGDTITVGADHRVTFTGSADPGTRVQLAPVGPTTVAGADGRWSFTQTVTPGWLVFRYMVSTNRTQTWSPGSFVVQIVEQSTSPIADVTLNSRASVTVREGVGVVTGTGEPGARITISGDGIAGAGEVDANGDWAVQTSFDRGGVQWVTATQVAEDGRENAGGAWINAAVVGVSG